MDFVEGVCSDRQYRRYLSGESQVSQRTIRKFCEKLEISSNDFYNSFHQNDHEEYAKVSAIYGLINDKKYKDALELINDISTHTFLSSLTKKFFQYCSITYRFEQEEIQPHYALDLYSRIINYPEILSKAEFNFVDIITLSQIAKIDSKYQRYDALYKLTELLESKKLVYTSSNTRYVYPSIYVKVIKLFWQKKDHDKAFFLINEGINYSIYLNDFTTLPELLYMKSFILKSLYNKHDESIRFASYCLTLLKIKMDHKRLEKYKGIFLKDFGESFVNEIPVV